ncbi:MAG: hypothetical protein KDJ49_05915 [Alphaproteobacteria bacterium]|nr:hypothetical protein [Alphaproteobacteria bacterium]USO07373.1 MAG: hypothetical protein H6866_08115 [Rhodospirillales bacterium]
MTYPRRKEKKRPAPARIAPDYTRRARELRVDDVTDMQSGPALALLRAVSEDGDFGGLGDSDGRAALGRIRMGLLDNPHMRGWYARSLPALVEEAKPEIPRVWKGAAGDLPQRRRKAQNRIAHNPDLADILMLRAHLDQGIRAIFNQYGLSGGGQWRQSRFLGGLFPRDEMQAPFPIVMRRIRRIPSACSAVSGDAESSNTGWSPILRAGRGACARAGILQGWKRWLKARQRLWWRRAIPCWKFPAIFSVWRCRRRR